MSRKDGRNEDLRSMVMSFRIAELQMLLGSCGRSRSGRKHELLGRANSLLKSSEGSPLRERVKSKILELYHQRYPAPGNSVSSLSSPSYNQSSYVPPYQSEKEHEPTYLNRPNHYKSQIQSQSSSHRASSFKSTNPCMQNIYESERNIHHVGGVPVHPDVRFINLPFFDIVDVLNKPTSLVQKTLVGYQETQLTCSLSPYQTQLITNSRSYNIKSIMEYGVQVHIRFCLAETSCVQEDLYPTRCKIIVNGKSCPLPGQPPPNAQNQEPRKPHRPVNITHLCRLSPMQSNQIAIQWMPSDMGQRYAATIHLVRAVQVTTLIKKLQNKPVRSSDHTKAFIKEKLRPDPDSEIALTSLKVSLCCPIGRTKMTMPCRANNCKHLQCFDGSLFIQMNERKPSWLCPVCDQKAHYDQLFKDGLFIDIINKANSDDIVFFEDGSWRPLTDVQDSSKPLSQIVNTPKVKPPVVDCKTPPTLSHSASLTPKRSLSPVQQVPVLEKMGDSASDVSNSSPNNQNAATQEADDPEVEIITIDDSDSDSEIEDIRDERHSVASNETMTRPNRTLSYPESNSQQQSSSLPFSDPDLQGLDLYNLLPREDRIAAAMYLDQAGFLGQLNNQHHSQASPSSIIDISDE